MKTTENPASLVFAKNLFTRATDAFGVEEINRAFGPHLAEAPPIPIPFTETELRRARELGQYLILQVAELGQGKPLTMQAIHTKSGNRLGDGKLLYNTDWYEKEAFYTIDTPRPGWALVGRDVIPGTTGMNYLEQTQAISDYLVNEVYRGMELPAKYRQAVDELKSRRTELETLLESDWQQCAKQLTGLQLNKLFREHPVEVIYGLVTQYEVNHERLLGDQYTWTNDCSSGGDLVFVGSCVSGGVRVCDNRPDDSCSNVGVRFFRSSADFETER